MAALARFAGSIVDGGFEPGANAPGFTLTRAQRADPVARLRTLTSLLSHIKLSIGFSGE
jgi:hypothetical protein